MSIFKWPFKRKQYAGIGNPRFVGDIVAANEAVIDGLKAITGLSDTEFAIITGLDYIAGAPNTYTAGIFYLNGSFYYIGTGFSEGLYLAPNPTDTEPQPFSDGNSRNIYTLLNGMTTASSTGASPIFTGDMNNYRLGLKNIKAQVLLLVGLYNALGNSATRNVGTIAGTVAAGDDPRFGYTKAQIDNTFARIDKVLQTDNTTAYTPTDGYNPATKAYADAAAGLKLRWYGSLAGDGSNVVTNFGPTASPLSVTMSRIGTGHYQVNHNLGSLNYFVSAIGTNALSQTVSPRTIANKTSTTFEVYTSNDSSLDDGTFECQIIQFF